MQKKFARRGLAWAPLGLHQFMYENEEGAADKEGRTAARVDAIRMPRVNSTLDKALQGKGALGTASHAASLGASLARLVSNALAAGMVHHDAKCNNIGVADDGTVRFIDFGRSFDERTLRKMGASRKAAERALGLGAALDAWRLQDSVARRMMPHVPEEESGESLRNAVVGPLRAIAATLLKHEEAIPHDLNPDAAWWLNQRVFEDLKAIFSSHLKCLAGRRNVEDGCF